MDLSTAASIRLGGEKEASSNPHWSPDGKWLSYSAGEGDKSGLWVAHADGSGGNVPGSDERHQLTFARARAKA